MRLAFCVTLVLTVGLLPLAAQTPAPPKESPQAPLPDSPDSTSKPATTTAVTVSGKDGPVARPEPVRILGILPNYRAVSAGAPAPPNSAGLNAKLAAEQSLDYSAFLFGGLTSLISEGRNTHPTFGKGPNGYGQYLWRNNVDRIDRNFQQTFLFPTLYHEDPRYYALEKGNPLHRIAYASTRTIITRTYSGRQTFNFASISGKLGSEAVSTTYYPNRNLDLSGLGIRLGFSIAREAAFTTFREFYPDLVARFHHKGSSEPTVDPNPRTAPQPLGPRPPV